MALAVLSAGAAAQSGSTRQGPGNPVQRLSPPRIANLKACAYEAFSLRLRRCVRDQRATVLTSSRFVCSAAVTVSRPATLRIQWTYEGVKLPPFFHPLAPGRHNHWIKLDIGADFPLPGGTYRCEFSIGRKRARATFVSGGPRGDIVTAVVCDDLNVFMYEGFPVCRTDQAGAVIRSPNAVICQAVYPNATGHVGRITLVRGSEQLGDRRFTVTEPMQQHYERFRAPSISPGKYTCRFSLDDNVVVDRPFEIS